MNYSPNSTGHLNSLGGGRGRAGCLHSPLCTLITALPTYAFIHYILAVQIIFYTLLGLTILISFDLKMPLLAYLPEEHDLIKRVNMYNPDANHSTSEDMYM